MLLLTYVRIAVLSVSVVSRVQGGGVNKGLDFQAKITQVFHQHTCHMTIVPVQLLELGTETMDSVCQQLDRPS